jgi:hypothetical protein
MVYVGIIYSECFLQYMISSATNIHLVTTLNKVGFIPPYFVVVCFPKHKHNTELAFCQLISSYCSAVMCFSRKFVPYFVKVVVAASETVKLKAVL